MPQTNLATMELRRSQRNSHVTQMDIVTVLAQLQEAGDSGALVLRGEQRGVVVVEPPYINLVTTDEERFGADIISTEIVDEATWRAALDGADHQAGGAIHALLDAGVEEASLRFTVYEHIITALFELLVLGDTEFEFLPGASHRLSVEPGFLFEDVLNDLNARVGEWRQLAEAIPGTDSTVTRLSELPNNLPSVTLSRAEYALLWHIQPQITVAEIIAATKRPAFDVMMQLYGLLQRGLIRIEEPTNDF